MFFLVFPGFRIPEGSSTSTFINEKQDDYRSHHMSVRWAPRFIRQREGQLGKMGWMSMLVTECWDIEANNMRHHLEVKWGHRVIEQDEESSGLGRPSHNTLKETRWIGSLMIPQGSWTREKPGKTFIQGFSSLIIFLKAGDKLPIIIFNTYTVILHLVTILKPSTVQGTSLRTL